MPLRLFGTTTRRWSSFFCLLLVASVALAAAMCKGPDPFQIRPGTVFVSVRDTFFTPETIRVGRTFPVRWTNEGALYHSVVADSGAFGSGLLQHHAWFEVRFDSTGTFTYHCSEHPTMVGAVVVDP